MHLNRTAYFQLACVLCGRLGELLWSLSLHYRNTRGSAMNFDPVLLSRIQFAWVIG
jgi:hypothetical protein